MGQCCSAGSRTFVHEKIYDDFVKKAVKLACQRKIGDPFQEGVQHGPQVFYTPFSPKKLTYLFMMQVSQEQYDKIMNLIDSGKKEGAKIACGGSRWGKEGFFIEPTVFTNVDDKMRIAQEEVFNLLASCNIVDLHESADFWTCPDHFQV